MVHMKFVSRSTKNKFWSALAIVASSQLIVRIIRIVCQSITKLTFVKSYRASYRYHHVCYALLQVYPASQFQMFLQLANLLLVAHVSSKQGLARFATSWCSKSCGKSAEESSPQILLRTFLCSWMLFRYALLQSTQPRLMLLILAVSTFGLKDLTAFHCTVLDL